jgi:hypothetical protein
VNRRRMARPTVGLAVVMAAALVAACSTGGSAPSAAASAPAAASPGGSAVALPAGFPVGTWTTTITAEDLEAVGDDFLTTIGMSRTNLVNENSGTFTTTFGADGTWSTVQDTDKPVKWPVFRGTISPVGDDAFDQVTSFPPDFAGDVVRFTWRTADGKLHLTVPDPPDPILPVVMEAHPWSPAG